MSADELRGSALEMLAAFDGLVRIRLAPAAYDPVTESRAWDRLYLAARAVEDSAYPVRGVTITTETPGAHTAAALRCIELHRLEPLAEPCDDCLTYYGADPTTPTT